MAAKIEGFTVAVIHLQYYTSFFFVTTNSEAVNADRPRGKGSFS